LLSAENLSSSNVSDSLSGLGHAAYSILYLVNIGVYKGLATRKKVNKLRLTASLFVG